MVIAVQITPDGKSNRNVIGGSQRTERGTYIQRSGTERSGALGAQAVQTDHDHAGHIILRGGRYERIGCEHISPRAVGGLRARQHNLRDGIYRQRERRRYHPLYEGRSNLYLQNKYFTPQIPYRLEVIPHISYIYIWRSRRKQSARKRQQSKII